MALLRILTLAIATGMGIGFDAAAVAADELCRGWYFAPPGLDPECQVYGMPNALGLSPDLAENISRFVARHADRRTAKSPRWALWRHGRLAHVEGDFLATADVMSLRKTWHAMLVGAALQQGRIQSLQQPLAPWLPELGKRYAAVTWRHVLTQASGFDYPYGSHPSYPPGRMWTYSDLNLMHLCNALARVYDRTNFHDHYEVAARQGYFDAIGLRGWNTSIQFDRASGVEDGVRFRLSLEHMGRLGLLALARGRWDGRQLVPAEFVRELETKQTRGMKCNYSGPNDGKVGLDSTRFPESPYGYLTWVNTDGDYFPNADRGWAWGAGLGGNIVLWNHGKGLVFAAVGVALDPSSNSIPHLLERGVSAPDPQLAKEAAANKAAGLKTVGLWGRFERAFSNPRRYSDPIKDVELDVTFISPDGRRVPFWGFYDAGRTWKVRFMPDQLGTWRYQGRFSDSSLVDEGGFLCTTSSIPGMISHFAPNSIWFGFKAGPAKLLRSFHVGDRFFARNWDDPEREGDGNKRTLFLDWAQRQGYNTLSIGSHYLNRNAPNRGQGWLTPQLWPLNPAEFRRLEMMLDDLARRRMIVFPFGGFFGRDADFPRDAAGQRLFMRYVLARLGPYWNMLFNVAGPEPLLARKPYLTANEIDRLGGELSRLDPFGHLLTVHNATGDDAFRDASWLSFGTLQGPKTVERARLGEILLRNHHPAKPLYAQETLWPGNKHHPAYSDSDLRKNAFVLMFCAATLNYADNAGDSSSGFSGTLELADRVQSRHDIVKHVWDFFETMPFQRMKPMPGCAQATGGGQAWCLGNPGQEYLVYLESRSTVDVDVIGGPFEAEWINAQRTSDRRPGGRTATGRGLRSPDDADDWLLSLRQ
jgi:CubicO group peptidase (beta-lactamase class C family)